MSLNRKTVIPAMLTCLLGGCDGTEFTANVGQVQESEPEPTETLEPRETPEAFTPPEEQTIVLDDPESRRRIETFKSKQNSQTEAIDYLFVLDNSPSMTSDLQQLQLGFRSIQRATFPKGSKLAVTYTQPADPKNPTTVFPYGDRAQQPTKAYNAEPGFLNLVDKRRIAAYRNTNGANGSKFRKKGCDQWFEPNARNSDGQSCFNAHTQISEKGGLCEAGMVALDQLLKAKRRRPLFRDGAALHVIFITDTEDPGCPKKEPYLPLGKARPSTNELIRALKSNSKLTSVTFHGAVPKSKCSPRSEGSPFNFGRPYAAAIRATKGIHVDMCTKVDYSAMIENVITRSTGDTSAKFRLSKAISQIEYVEVDGKEYRDFTVQGGFIEIRGLSEDRSHDVKVAYVY